MLPESPSGPKVDSIAGNKPIAKNVAAEISNKMNIPNFEKGIIGEKTMINELIAVVKKAPITDIPISAKAFVVRSYRCRAMSLST